MPRDALPMVGISDLNTFDRMCSAVFPVLSPMPIIATHTAKYTFLGNYRFVMPPKANIKLCVNMIGINPIFGFHFQLNSENNYR